MDKLKIAVFVSGSGTNCENIIRYFRDCDYAEVSVVVSSDAKAGAIERAKRLGVPTAVITRSQLRDEPHTIQHIIDGCGLIVLAGFLLFIPEYLLDMYPNRIINIHPSLLPKFGGKGMWGHHVHEAVKAAGETETGITIHYVDAMLDRGKCIAQYTTPLSPADTPNDIAAKVHELEMRHFPEVIDGLVRDMIQRQ